MQRFGATVAVLDALMDDDDRLAAALAATSTAPSRRLVRGAPGSPATRSPCGCSATRATPRRPPRTRWSEPTGRWPPTTRRPDPRAAAAGWLTTIVLNLCRTGGASQATPRAAPASIDGDAGAAGRRAGAAPRAAPTEVAERHAERERWAARLATLPTAYRAAVVLRHVDGLSYPEAAAALGRPEGTVKAQVHRGIALLRTMLEAEPARELQEMTA